MGPTADLVTIPAVQAQALDFKAVRITTAARSANSQTTPTLAHSEEVASEIPIRVHLGRDLYLGQTLPRSVPPGDEGYITLSWQDSFMKQTIYKYII